MNNFDQVVALWSTDPEFRAAVRQDPAGALSRHGIELTADELAALSEVDLGGTDAELMERMSRSGKC